MNDDKELTTSHSTPTPSVKVNYWFGEGDLEGIEEFHSELSESYSTTEVKGRQGGLGGGLYTLFIEIASSITLPHFVQLIIDGIAFDAIKLGATQPRPAAITCCSKKTSHSKSSRRSC